MILYHGTSEVNAKKIMEHGFNPGAMDNWKVKSMKGFIYLSTAYAPYYAMASKPCNGKIGALIQVEVDEKDLYPDEDFIMYAVHSKSTFTNAELRKMKFALETYKELYVESLQYLGNACAKPQDIKILGVRYFNMDKLILVCDPTPNPMNFKFKGKDYQKLTTDIYNGKSVEDIAKEQREETMKLFNILGLEVPK